MFKETLTEHDDVIGLGCEGKLSEDDFERMHTLIHERLSQGGRPGLLLDLTKFEGYENALALLEDIKIDTAHANDFSRIAVVGERSWMEWGTKIVNVITLAEMRWFKATDFKNAIAWLRDT